MYFMWLQFSNHLFIISFMSYHMFSNTSKLTDCFCVGHFRFMGSEFVWKRKYQKKAKYSDFMTFHVIFISRFVNIFISERFRIVNVFVLRTFRIVNVFAL